MHQHNHQLPIRQQYECHQLPIHQQCHQQCHQQFHQLPIRQLCHQYPPTMSSTMPPIMQSTTNAPTKNALTTNVPITSFPITAAPTTNAPNAPTGNVPTQSPYTTNPSRYTTDTIAPTTINHTVIVINTSSTIPTTIKTTLTLISTSENMITRSNINVSFNKSWINYVVISILIFIFFVMIVIGLYDSKKHKYKFNTSNIMWFAYHMLDFFTDILFVLLLYNSGYIDLFVIGLLFIFISSTVSIFQLNRNIKLWITDDNTEWFEQYATFLYVICFIVGSCQSAVQLTTSNFLQFNRFKLKLDKYYQIKLHNEHLWSSVILENIPQFVLEVLFIIETDTLNDITLVAMIFSVSSIIMAPFIYMTRRHLILNHQQINANENQQYVLLEQ
eukprot:399333_1